MLAEGATFAGRQLQAGDIAVIVAKHKDAAACFKALCDAGVPAVYTGDSDVFASDAAQDWLCLLEAFDQPHRPGMVRAAAATMFFGETAESLSAGGDALTDRVAETCGSGPATPASAASPPSSRPRSFPAWVIACCPSTAANAT